MKSIYALIVCVLFSLFASCTPPTINSEYAAHVVAKTLHISEPVTGEKLYGGLNTAGAQIFLVKAGSEKYVVRFFSKNSSKRDREIACLQIASDAGYGPHIYAIDREKNFVIMEYLERKRNNERSPQALGEALYKLHHGPSFPKIETIFDDMKNVIHTLKAHKCFGGPFLQMEKMVSFLEKELSSVRELAPCHNDLNPNNMIFSGASYKIIDYEFATEDDPYFDIATVLFFNSYEPGLEEKILNAYFKRSLLPKEKAKLYLMKQVVRISYSVRFLSMLPDKAYDWNMQPDTYANLSTKIWKGELNFSDPDIQFRLALALFTEAVNDFQSKEFQDAVNLLRPKE